MGKCHCAVLIENSDFTVFEEKCVKTKLYGFREKKTWFYGFCGKTWLYGFDGKIHFAVLMEKLNLVEKLDFAVLAEKLNFTFGRNFDFAVLAESSILRF